MFFHRATASVMVPVQYESQALASWGIELVPDIPLFKWTFADAVESLTRVRIVEMSHGLRIERCFSKVAAPVNSTGLRCKSEERCGTLSLEMPPFTPRWPQRQHECGVKVAARRYAARTSLT